MEIFTHGVEKLLFELNFSNNNKFCNVFLNINEVSVVIVISNTLSLRNDCNINPILSDNVCVFAGKYDNRGLQNKERLNVLFVMI